MDGRPSVFRRRRRVKGVTCNTILPPRRLACSVYEFYGHTPVTAVYAFMADPAIRSDRPTEIIKKSGRPEACIRGDWDIGPHGLEPG